MTKSQRAALKIAMEYMQAAMRPLAFDANVAMRDPNAPPSIQKRLEKYKELAAAMTILESMLHSRQTEMKL